METSKERLLQLNNELILATQNGNLMQIKNLIGQGASKNTRDHVENTLLMIATQIGHFNLVEYFIIMGVDVNATNLFKTSAIDIAEKNNFPEIARLLKNDECHLPAVTFSYPKDKPFKSMSGSCSPRNEDKGVSSTVSEPKTKSSKCIIS